MPAIAQTTTSNRTNQYLLPFILVTSLFFLWAFLHNMNPILIPHLKKACQLSDAESALIDSAVYLGYFLMALPAGWFMHKYGYKKGILFGLLLMGSGTLLFVPAASARSYVFFLGALFIMAIGAAVLETIANPYMAKLGNDKTSEQRLNLAQSFNGVGAFLAPILGGKFILSGIEHTPDELKQMNAQQLAQYLNYEAGLVKIPYIILAGVVFLVFLLFLVNRIPEVKNDVDAAHGGGSFSAKVLRRSHVAAAVIAQFFYVGAQTCVGSFFIRFSRSVMGIPEKDAAYWWGSIALVGFMVGRFTGTLLMRYIKPAKLLALYSVINIVLLAVAITAKGNIAVYAVMASPFFMSIMFPTIFALGLKDLGEESKMASAFLIMSIVGGAIIPPIMGYISDRTGSMQTAYIVPLLCFAVVLYFGLRGYKVKEAQMINHQ
jgi:MFS transporter, FHS family, L-fucose permease